MKIVFFTVMLFVIHSVVGFSQADKIIGYWLTAEGDSQILIFKSTDGRYFGKIIWMRKNRYARDYYNPDDKLKTRKVMGLQVLNNLTYNAINKEWVNGTVYDPRNGNTYDCYIWLNKDNQTLNMKGFVLGMRFLGRQTTWKRESGLRAEFSQKQ